MTDKEMAEEYFEELKKKKIPFNMRNVNREIKKAYLAGLKASKVKEEAKNIIQDLLSNSDEYARQRAINFLKEVKN